MSIFLDIFYFHDDDFLMWAFGGMSMSSMLKSEEISEKQCGSVDNHDNQEAQFVVQHLDIEDTRANLQEGCKEEQSVEDQMDKPHEVDCKYAVEEDKARENLKYDISLIFLRV